MSGTSIEDYEKSVDRTLALLETAGADDIFKPPFFCSPVEYDYLKNPAIRTRVRGQAIEFLRKKKVKGFKNLSKFAVPKNPYAYRNASFIDIEDLVKFTALVLMAAEHIENARIDRDKRVVFSYRYNKTGHIFSDKFTFKEFRQESARRSSQRKHKVKIATDIANFYDRLNLHRLESSLADVGVPSDLVRALNSLLIFWAGRNSYGIPVGCDASRLLAECALISVDSALMSRGVNFVRFVDDYRIFAASHAEAHSHLHFLIQELDREGLFLNTSKTVFFDIYDGDPEQEQAENTGLNEFEVIDETEAVSTTRSVKVGYVSKIVKNYRFPGKEKIAKLQVLDLEEAAHKAGRAPFEQAEDEIKTFVQAFIYQGANRPELLGEVLAKYVHSFTYVVDALIKEADRIDAAAKDGIKRVFVDYYASHRMAPYYRLMVLRLLAHPKYLSLDFLNRFFDDMSIGEGDVLVREFCLHLLGISNRDLLNRCRQIYDQMPVNVRRAIFHSYTNSSAILWGEKMAWVKNVNVSETDPIIKILAGRFIGGH